jgi:hypothetical protein
MFVLFAEVLLFRHATNYLLASDPFVGELRSASRRQILKWFFFRGTVAAILILAIARWWPGMLLATIALVEDEASEDEDDEGDEENGTDLD